METTTLPRPIDGTSKAPERRSPVTNRTRLHEDLYEVNGNKAVAKRFRDLVDSLLAELGEPHPTDHQQTLIRTASMATVRMEAMEAAHCAERPVSDAVYTRLVGTLRQARADLGLDGKEDSDKPPPAPGGGGVAETLAAAGKSMPDPTKVGE